MPLFCQPVIENRPEGKISKKSGKWDMTKDKSRQVDENIRGCCEGARLQHAAILFLKYTEGSIVENSTKQNN